MRLTAFMFAIFGLAGCGLWRFDFAVPEGFSGDKACIAVAASRASDAGMSGEDDKTQQDVFRRTYSDCDQWRLTHPD
jgi:hypothetical protein